jgi:hypothetical protein
MRNLIYVLRIGGIALERQLDFEETVIGGCKYIGNMWTGYRLRRTALIPLRHSTSCWRRQGMVIIAITTSIEMCRAFTSRVEHCTTRKLTVGTARRRCGGVGGRSARGQGLWGKW